MNAKPMFPYHWSAADLYELIPDEQAEVAKKHKRCALCGKEKPLTHSKYSGGCVSYICEDCAVDYVLKAESVKTKYEIPAPAPIPLRPRQILITVPAHDFDEIREAIEEFAEEEGITGITVEVVQ